MLERMMMFLKVQRTMNTIVVMMRTMMKPLGKKNRRVMLGRPKQSRKMMMATDPALVMRK